MTTAAAPGAAGAVATVVIPARNEEAFIEGCLASVLAQDEPRLQVIVVDGDSEDDTAGIVRRMAGVDPRVELLSNPGRTIPKALNRAVEAARAPWLVRVDAHSTVPPDYVRRAVDHLQSGRWGGVGGRKDGIGRTPAGQAVAAVLGSPFGVGNSQYHHATAIKTVDHIPFGAYPTKLVRELGGWDERLTANEDYEFDYRVRRSGHQLLLDPRLRIDWYCRQSVRELFGQYRRYGRGKADVVALHPTSLSPRHLAAPLLVASWLAGALFLRRRPRLVAAVAAPYGAALAVASAVTARRLEDGRARVYLPAAFAAMHAGWGIGFWEGLARVVLSRAGLAPAADRRRVSGRPSS